MHLAVATLFAAVSIGLWFSWTSAYGQQVLDDPGNFPLYIAGKVWYWVSIRSCAEDRWSPLGIHAPVVTLSFAGAKSVDLAWNWVVGGGVQLLFGLFAYHAFADALLKAAEEFYVPMPVIMPLLVFSTKPSIIWQLVRNFSRLAGWRVWALVIWAIISTIFLAFFPPLMDLSTGYEPINLRYFKAPGNSEKILVFDEHNHMVDHPSTIFGYAGNITLNVALHWSISMNINVKYILSAGSIQSSSRAGTAS